ncbi:hypothetical protein B1P88_06045 [Enterococcus faecium]|uniref:Uncharacterized protein n=1 Tax=Enterococcus faecium TaxID=1352 RepID=A0A1M2WXX6_ENTFC|nr:hypothetical protein AL026_08000 [Enterococcus faecium]APV56861.1 hypothetical protein AL023_06100 [Enterococcus faecium]AUO62796.1 hypothetical protein BXT96_14530 [Enterococcus faecium]KAF3363794.1 hypothetical protein BXA47_14805 [Enterococcus faecium]KAF3367159.1 hypothetical protein BXA48_16045 [Enterococcus faecium]
MSVCSCGFKSHRLHPSFQNKRLGHFCLSRLFSSLFFHLVGPFFLGIDFSHILPQFWVSLTHDRISQQIAFYYYNNL